MTPSKLWIARCVCLLGLAAPAAFGNFMFAIQSAINGHGLYAIDESTGNATLLQTLSLTSAISDLALLNGNLYVTDLVGDPSGDFFGILNPSTGAFTGVNNQLGNVNLSGLAAVPSQNLLYATNSQNENLYSITPAGVMTLIAKLTLTATDLAYDPNHDVLYAATGGSLFRIDRSTGQVTAVGAFGINPSGGREGLGYDALLNELFLTDATNGNFYSVSTTTGGVTFIGNTGVIGLDGLADVPTPEPASMGLVFTGLVVMVVRNRRVSHRLVGVCSGRS